MKNSVLSEIPERAEPKKQSKVNLVVIGPPAPNPAEGLFSDVLLETSRVERRRKAISTMISLTLQCIFFGILLLIPLMFTDVLPAREMVTMLLAPPPPPPPPPPPAMTQVTVAKPTTNVIDGRLLAPSKIPKEVAMIKEDTAPAGAIGVVGGVEGGTPGGQVNGVMGGILSNTKPLDLPKPPPAPKIIRVSQGVSEGMLTNRVVPDYPAVAKVARVQGAVELKAIISTDGTIKNIQLVSGNPLLVTAAMQAVERWRYKPYLLNGSPVEVETNITVRFNLVQQN